MTGTVREFHFAYIRIWTGDLWISNPALYKCVTVTSGFDLWQFQVFNTGAEALLVLMFWLDYLREVQLAHNGIWTWDLWISSPVVKHYAAVSSGFHLWKFQVFNCGAEEFVVVLFWLDLWEIFFLPTLEFELGIYGSQILQSHYAAVTSGFHIWQSQVFNSGAEGLVVVLF